MSYHTGVVEALRDHSLELGFCPGWETRGSPVFWPQGAVAHHDAVAARWTTPPGLLIAGRPDLAGPLCNTALAATGKVWLVAAGRANHAGTGGWRGLVGNSTVWGTEAQNAGTGQTWPDEQIDSYARLHTALGDYFGFDAAMVCRHAEWAPSRKIDPWGPWADGHRWELDADHFRDLVASPALEEDFMATLSDEEKAAFLAALQEINGVGAAFGAPAVPSLREKVQAEARTTRRMTLDLVDAAAVVLAQETGVNPDTVRARIRALLKPETRAALDKVD